MAWIEFRAGQNENGKASVLTTGMKYFGRMEIEVIDSTRPLSEVLNVVAGVAHITLLGEEIPDGDTVGFDAETKIPVHHAKSFWDREDQVLRLDF